ncbi:MAG TPA: hypothetical protein VFG04_08925 [Planctomycetaceae bacterium]|jgi:hypothetical protein|nr:hypothetical protein [Planctomycetaceae bacterium]
MPATPFVVIDRGSKRVLHQARTLGEARGYSEARDEPTTIGMIPEAFNATEWSFCFQCVKTETGEILMQSESMDFDEAADAMYGLKLLLVPAYLAERKAVTP